MEPAGKPPPRVAVIDDDFASEALVDCLLDAGFDVKRFPSAAGAVAALDELATFDLVVLDIMLERPPTMSETATRGGFRTGVVIARDLRRKRPQLPILFHSGSREDDIGEWHAQPNTFFLSKLAYASLNDVTARVSSILGSSFAILIRWASRSPVTAHFPLVIFHLPFSIGRDSRWFLRPSVGIRRSAGNPPPAGENGKWKMANDQWKMNAHARKWRNSSLGVAKMNPMPRTFIVHGHDEATKFALKNYLQNTLRLPEPIILHEQPSQGKTILAKFEHYSRKADVAFILLTPDDKIVDPSKPDADKRRARQNVILELGYFLGSLGPGRVILLHKGPTELPSDIHGVVYIDITNGMEAAGESIRRELANVS